MKKLALIFVLMFGLWSCSAKQGAADAANVKATAAPDPDYGSVPNFELAKISGGTLKSTDLKGKIVVYDFWATWCENCIQEVPNYNALYAKYRDKDVEFLGVTLESGTIDDVKPKVTEFKMNYPIIMGTDKMLDGFGGSIGFPMTFVVTRDGKIHHKYLGQTPGKKDAIAKEIDGLLARDATEGNVQ